MRTCHVLALIPLLIMTNSSTQRLTLFENTLEEHSGAMLHYLYGLCKDWQIAEDLSQELWAHVHRYFEKTDFTSKALLYRKAKQVFIDYYRKIKRRPDLDFSDHAYDGVITPERNEAESAQDEERLFKQFWEIFYPDEYDEISKRLFWLHHRYGYSIEDAAREVGLARATAHDRLTRLRERCRQRLSLNNH